MTTKINPEGFLHAVTWEPGDATRYAMTIGALPDGRAFWAWLVHGDVGGASFCWSPGGFTHETYITSKVREREVERYPGPFVYLTALIDSAPDTFAKTPIELLAQLPGRVTFNGVRIGDGHKIKRTLSGDWPECPGYQPDEEADVREAMDRR